MASAYIQTYGCSANQNNSEIVAGLLARDGNTIANDVASADAIIINTCTVKEKTTDKIKRRIQDLQRLFPNKKMIVTGCMAQTDGEKIKKLNRNAIIVGTDHYTEIPSMLNESPLISIRTAKQNTLCTTTAILTAVKAARQNAADRLLQKPRMTG